jgi:hypothetical protein
LQGAIPRREGRKGSRHARIVVGLARRHGHMVPQENRLVRTAYRPGVSWTPSRSLTWPLRARRTATGHETYFTAQWACGKLATSNCGSADLHSIDLKDPA